MKRLSCFRHYLLSALLLALSATAVAAPMRFVYPPPENVSDQRQTYYWDLLRAVLDSNRERYGDYTLEAFSAPMSYQRAQSELEAGGERITIFAPASNRALEKSLLAIPLPLDKGLLGLRLFLIMESSQTALDQVKTVGALKRFTIGQRPTWTDAMILEHNGFLVVATDSFEGLFKGLAAHRFDLFSRGANEIQAEWLSRREAIPGLAVEKKLALLYPMARYYFVPRTAEGERMAERIRDGLLRLAASGEFERRYQAYKATVLKDLPLAGRQVFRLQNPELSGLAPPLDDRRWWDDFKAELAPKR
jgi:ABC-type amino acid transport substrate-binding protein